MLLEKFKNQICLIFVFMSNFSLRNSETSLWLTLLSPRFHEANVTGLKKNKVKNFLF